VLSIAAVRTALGCSRPVFQRSLDMAEFANVQSNNNNVIAKNETEANPSASPTSPQPGEGTLPKVQPGAIGSGVGSISADDKKAMGADMQKVIDKWSPRAGLGKLKSDGSHEGNMTNAAEVVDKLPESEKKACLIELARAGRDYFNWGLKLGTVPINQLGVYKGKGADAANPGSVPGNSQTPASGATPPAKNSTPAESGNVSAPNGVTPDKALAAISSLMEQVAASDKNGDAKSITRADIKAFDAKGSDPRVGELLKRLDGALAQLTQRTGKDSVTVDQAAQFALTLMAKPPSGAVQGDPSASPPGQQPVQEQQETQRQKAA
jgi:hypothetical protein